MSKIFKINAIYGKMYKYLQPAGMGLILDWILSVVMNVTVGREGEDKECSWQW